MSRRFVLYFALAILCVLMSYSSAGAQASTAAKDPRIGTWTLNLEKSRFTAGNEPKMQVRRITSRLTDPYTVTITRFDVTGKVTGTSTQVMSQDGRTVTVTFGLGNPSVG